MADSADPSRHYRIGFDLSSINRIVDELSALGGADKGKKFDLVKRNLERHVRSAEDDLARYEGFVASRPRITEDMSKALAALRKAVADLKEKLDALNAEGRPQ